MSKNKEIRNHINKLFSMDRNFGLMFTSTSSKEITIPREKRDVVKYNDSSQNQSDIKNLLIKYYDKYSDTKRKIPNTNIKFIKYNSNPKINKKNLSRLKKYILLTIRNNNEMTEGIKQFIKDLP